MRILRAELDKGMIKEEVFTMAGHAAPGAGGLVMEYLAGDPGKPSPLILATGLFAGTRLAGGGILAMGWISPEAEASLCVFGGDAASRLTDHGIKTVIIEGTSPMWVYLHISEDGRAELRDASDLTGKGTARLTRILRERHGERSSVISVGPLGEEGSSASCVVCTDPDPSLPPRQAAGGGMGRAFGERRLLAVVTEHSPRPFRIPFDTAAATRFDELCSVINAAIAKDTLTGEMLPLYGPLTDGLEGSPWRELLPESSGGWEKREKAAWRENMISSGGLLTIPCVPGCTVRCSNIAKERRGNAISTGLDHEAAFMFGSLTGIFGLKDILAIDSLCADAGCDLLSAGEILGELSRQGALGFPDPSGAKRLIRGMLSGTGAAHRALSGYGNAASRLPGSGIKRGHFPGRGELSASCFMCPLPWRALMKDAPALRALTEMCSLMGWEAAEGFPESLEEALGSMESRIRQRLSEG